MLLMAVLIGEPFDVVCIANTLGSLVRVRAAARTDSFASGASRRSHQLYMNPIGIGEVHLSWSAGVVWLDAALAQCALG
jgi:hypothetical protein